MGSGSLSSENRSISPTQSDDSRSVTPPTVQPPILAPVKQDAMPDKPKPPQRKRRPAPKPPQPTNTETVARETSAEKAPSSISLSETPTATSEDLKKVDGSGLTICHSRNSSDSSGYHEASVLSDHFNTSLPRRPKSAYINGDTVAKLDESATNLTQMSSHSKSTSSLAFAGTYLLLRRRLIAHQQQHCFFLLIKFRKEHVGRRRFECGRQNAPCVHLIQFGTFN